MNQNPLDNYMKMQNFVQKEARDIATQVYNELGTRFSVANVPVHTHNGIDTNQIEEVNIIKNDKNASGLIFDTSETLTLKGLNLPNFSRLVFHGFAANNADGTPATKRAIINGEVQFGRCYTFSGSGTGTIAVTTVASGEPFIQLSNSMYVDSTDLTKNRVATSSDYFVYVTDDTSSIVASIKVDSYTNNSITMTCVVGTNWKIQGNLILT